MRKVHEAGRTLDDLISVSSCFVSHTETKCEVSGGLEQRCACVFGELDQRLGDDAEEDDARGGKYGRR
jgi:hypothetical protein